MTNVIRATDRFLRQSQLIHPDMQHAEVLLVGVGMLGSWTAHSLARTVGSLHIFDHDKIGVENIGTQAYAPESIGDFKASNLASVLPHIVLPYATRFDEYSAGLIISRDTSKPFVVISAADSFAVRADLARYALAHGASLFVDTRAHGTVGVVIGFKPTEAAVDAYCISTEADDATAPAPACGMEGTAFVGMWVAQQVTSVLNRHFKGLPFPAKLVFDAGLGCILHEVASIEPEGGTTETDDIQA